MMKAELDSVEVTFFSETFDREITADCNYKFYAGRGATKTDPEEAPERDKQILKTERRDPTGWRYGIEAAAGYKDTAINFQRLLAGRRMVEIVPVSKDKVTRADPLEPIFDAGHVHVLKAPWNDLFYSQFAGFPKGAKHDDIVDGVSGAYAMLVDRAMPEGIVERFDGIAAFGGTIRDLDGGL